jgi:ABC-type phosphate transport system substrate-binding protein
MWSCKVAVTMPYAALQHCTSRMPFVAWPPRWVRHPGKPTLKRWGSHTRSGNQVSEQGFRALVLNSAAEGAPTPAKGGMTTMRYILFGAILALIVPAPDGQADPVVKVHGATTVAYGLLSPNKSKIEALAGVALAILPSSTSRGLADLVDRKADIAMLAEPLDTIAATLNARRPRFVDLAQYADAHVGNAYVQFIVHPSNPIKALGKEELAGLFSGRVKNWSEIGGANQGVLLVGEPTSTPHRLTKESLGIDYAPEMRVVQNTNQTAVIVAQAPGAISYISTAHDLPIRDKLKVVQTDLELPLALHLAFRKDAPDDVKRVVGAAAKVGKE